MNIKIALLSAACALALSACGDSSTPPADTSPAEPAAAPAAPVEPATTEPAAAPAPAETPDAAPADADSAAPADSSEPVASGCEITIESNDAMQFNTKAITVPASCTDFTITMNHVGSMPVAAMGHNVVITSSADMAGVAADGMAAGLESGFLKADDDRVVAATDMIGGGETTSVTFAVSDIQGGDYKFFCSFPGHSALMNGTITVE
ncbi:azurin [Luteimonas dalianensis]|uniref:azurin n=1 Tax=Luteimonas dalianensis TaxID=1148196 RepID=UPI003BEF7680